MKALLLRIRFKIEKKKRIQSANIMQASSDSDFLPAKHVNFNLTVAGFVPYQEP